MRIGKLIRTAIKVAPIVYPIIKKVLNNRKASTTSTVNTRK